MGKIANRIFAATVEHINARDNTNISVTIIDPLNDEWRPDENGFIAAFSDGSTATIRAFGRPRVWHVEYTRNETVYTFDMPRRTS